MLEMAISCAGANWYKAQLPLKLFLVDVVEVLLLPLEQSLLVVMVAF